MFAYVIADLVRNRRRTLSTMAGIVLGVGLFCGVLFFVDGLSASMTQRALAPLAIDMQRIVTERAGASLSFDQEFDRAVVGAGETATVRLELRNNGATPANEVTVRSRLAEGLAVVEGSARLDGAPLVDDAAGAVGDENPFAMGPARTGRNLGTLDPGDTTLIEFQVVAERTTDLDGSVVVSTYSTRESVDTIPAGRPPVAELDELVTRLAALPGIDQALPLSIADLGRDMVHLGAQTATGPTRIFGFDAAYAAGDDTIMVTEGELTDDGVVLSAEAARALGAEVGDLVAVDLPDGTTVELDLTGVAELTRARALFSSRRGGDLETFVYTPNAVIVSSALFADRVFPAFEQAAASGEGRLLSPPIREVDIGVDREALDADPATALAETEQIAAAVMAVAVDQDYLLDNVTNTLGVAAADASVGKRLFVFLGVPGALLAAALAAYAGTVLAEAQRRDHAALRIRGASARYLRRTVALRTAVLTGTGAIVGSSVGWGAAVAVLGRRSLARAGTGDLVTSAAIGTLGGLVATGMALHLTGRRSVTREINADRARLVTAEPLWRRLHLDAVALAVLAGATGWALVTDAFAGASGSVYFGRSVDVRLGLLVLPVMAWIAGSLLASRLVGAGLIRSSPPSNPALGRTTMALLRRSAGRRPWAIANATIVVALIVGLSTGLAGFTASYDQAKVADARFANGADIRITPGPTSAPTRAADDTAAFVGSGVGQVTPVIAGLSNVVLRSARTSDPANLVALEPDVFTAIAPVDTAAASILDSLVPGEASVAISADMADFLQVEVGDTLSVLLARATPDQMGVDLTVVGTYERLPGFPDGADAVMHLADHSAALPSKTPDFFLASATDASQATLDAAVAALRAGPGAAGGLQIDTRTGILDRDQSSLAALNIAGLVELDSAFAFAMAVVAVAIFVFGLILERRRELVTLRAQGLDSATIRLLIGAEAALVALAGTITGVAVGAVMSMYLVAVLRPLFVLDPRVVVPAGPLALLVGLVAAATLASAVAGSRVIARLEPTELLRDE